MNDLAVMTDAQLSAALAEQAKRAAKLQTEEGRRTAGQEMLKIFGVLESCGYQIRPDGRKAAAAVWIKALAPEISAIGIKGLQRAIMNVIEHDEREYRTLPNIATVKAACHELGEDPAVEKGKREQAKREAAIEAQRRAELNKWIKENPEKWAKIKKEEQCYE